MGCPLKVQCTTNKKFRRIKRWEHEAVLERLAHRVKANPEIIKQRKAIVEHPFNTIKFWNDQRHFLRSGWRKSELSLVCRRWPTISSSD